MVSSLDIMVALGITKACGTPALVLTMCAHVIAQV